MTEPIVYVDGGSSARQSHKEGFSVGDGDSFAGELDEKLPTNKDYSDLAYVFQNSINRFQEINLIGFLGGRRDHELINIGEACSFLNEQTIKTKISFGSEVIVLSKGIWEININGLFSVVSFSSQKILLSGACKYQIENSLLKSVSSHGLSNEGHGQVKLECEEALVIFLSN
jgi:thiamine pyrophosphokinase